MKDGRLWEQRMIMHLLLDWDLGDLVWTINCVANDLRDFENVIPSLLGSPFPIFAVLSSSGWLSHLHELDINCCSARMSALAPWFSHHVGISLCVVVCCTGSATPCRPCKSSFKNEKFLCMHAGWQSPCLLSPTISVWNYTLSFQAKELLTFSVTPINLGRYPRPSWWIWVPPNKIGPGIFFGLDPE